MKISLVSGSPKDCNMSTGTVLGQGIRSKRPRVDATQAESMRPNVLSRCAPSCSQLPYGTGKQSAAQQLLRPNCYMPTWTCIMAVRVTHIYQVVADSNFKYVLEIKDVPKFKDART